MKSQAPETTNYIAEYVLPKTDKLDDVLKRLKNIETQLQLMQLKGR